DLKVPPTNRLRVVVVIDPTLIRDDILPRLKKSLKVALAAVMGASFLTYLISAFAFRPLGRLKEQLDLVVASGDYQPPVQPESKPATDELGVMASKVSLLGERLRGAQYEVSDLRGNVERLFQDLEDAVLIFSRERRLVFASASVEKFLGRE